MISWVAFFLFSLSALAEETTLPEVVVSGAEARLKRNEIPRVESLRPDSMHSKRAQTFSNLVDDERGVNSETACAFCGAKRISINGLKGEHTTLLVDGLSLHSAVSGSYGVEAIPLGGIDSIEIFRGAGAALARPESIGGTIDIVTREIVENEVRLDVSSSAEAQQSLSVLGARKLSLSTGFFVGAQVGETSPQDRDGNGVAESPRQGTRGVTLKISHEFDDVSDMSLRLGYAELETLGGTMSRTRPAHAPSVLADSSDFANRDVRERFIGDESKISDLISVGRAEAALIYRCTIGDDASVRLGLGRAQQGQNSIYSHGYDYGNDDTINTGVAEYQKSISDAHLLGVGVDFKTQRMRSRSRELYEVRGFQKDDLDFRSVGLYAQDTWLIDEGNEISLVLRGDRLRVEWPSFNAGLERTVLAPRLAFKRVHGPIWTSRVSYGLGYRAPLTLFESQHGVVHDGFTVEIKDLERAHSVVYSLSAQRLDDFAEFAVHGTRIESMAYGEDTPSAPIKFKNSHEDYLVTVLDLGYGRRFSNAWNVEGVIEAFAYPSGYKAKLPVAAVERRLSLVSNWTWGPWTTQQKLIVVGERDLSTYGYGRHFNIAYTDDDVLSPTFGQTVTAAQKSQKAPAYFTVDLDFERKVSDTFTLTFSVLNALNYTQTGAGDSPTTWELHGDHYHLDNFHLWGPLKGRQIFLGLRGEF